MAAIDRQQAFSGVKPLSPALAMNLAGLERWLGDHLPGFAGPLTAVQFKGGQSNPTLRLDTPGRAFVLRRKPPGRLLPKAHAVDREFRVMAALSAKHYPVPEPLIYCGDRTVIGVEFYIMSLVEGRVIWDPSMPGATAPERRAVYRAMIEALADLHAIDPQAAGLADFGRPEGYAARQVARWSAAYRASETARLPAMDRLMAWLPDHAPVSARAAVVHGDFRLDNLILAPDAARVAAVLDWELATLGDPLADLAHHLMTWIMPSAPSGAGTGSLAGLDLARLGLPSLEDQAQAYASRAGLAEIPRLDAYLAYSLFRMAAILQGVAGRAREGTAANEHAALMGSQVGPLADLAWVYARRAGAR